MVPEPGDNEKGHRPTADRSDRTGSADAPVVASHTRPMGFNPQRQYKHNAADYVIVGAAVVICALLLAWAFLG